MPRKASEKSGKWNIHQNPVKAGLVKHVEEYKWSSFCEYVNQANLVDVNFFLEMIAMTEKGDANIYIIYQ